MGENTEIAWCDSTFNGWVGCSEVSPGCDNCYARSWAKRSGHPELWEGARRRTKTWNDPVKWNREHEKFFAEHGRRQRVFCHSLADWLDNEVPIDWLVDLLRLIMETPNLDWLLLTKRIGNFQKRLEAAKAWLLYVSSGTTEDYSLLTWIDQWLAGPSRSAPSSVAIGITVVNQDEADRDIPKLLRVPARIRFLSMEPLLGPVSLLKWCPEGRADWQCSYCHEFFRGPLKEVCPGCHRSGGWCGSHVANKPDPGRVPSWVNKQPIDWVIVGGEDGPRPVHPDWVRWLRDQCVAAGVPFLFKQWGRFLPEDQQQPGMFQAAKEYQLLIPPDHSRMPYYKIGKKKAGRLLDGRTWDQFPELLCQ